MGSASRVYIYELWAIISIVHGFALRAKNVFLFKITAVQVMPVHLLDNADNIRLFQGRNHVQLRLIPAIKSERIL